MAASFNTTHLERLEPALRLRLVAPHVSELPWPLDEPPLPVRRSSSDVAGSANWSI
jgi:hypothetical protein